MPGAMSGPSFSSHPCHPGLHLGLILGQTHETITLVLRGKVGGGSSPPMTAIVLRHNGNTSSMWVSLYGEVDGNWRILYT